MSLLSWLNPLNALAGGLLEAQRNYYAAQNDSDRLKADTDIKFWQSQIDLAQVAAERDRWWSTRELIGKCVLIYLAKLIVWDTVFGLGVTQDPGATVNWITATVIGFYFASRSAEKIADTFATAMMRRK